MTILTKKDPTIKNIFDAFRILDLINQDKRIGLNNIVAKLELPKTTAFRILKTLEKIDIVRRTETSDYVLGYHLIKYNQVEFLDDELVDVVKPHLTNIRNITGECTNLGMKYDGKLYIPLRIHGEPYQLQVMLPPIGELYCSAMGKIFMTEFSKVELLNYFKSVEQRTVNTITNYKDFIKYKNDFSKSGISIDNEEYEYGMSCYAIPIFKENKKVLCCISVTGPTSRLNHKGTDLIIATLRKEASLIQKDVQHLNL